MSQENRAKKSNPHSFMFANAEEAKKQLLD